MDESDGLSRRGQSFIVLAAGALLVLFSEIWREDHWVVFGFVPLHYVGWAGIAIGLWMLIASLRKDAS